MFIFGFTVTLLFILLLGLTVIRLRVNRPNPNSKLLADLMGSLDKAPTPKTMTSKKNPNIPSYPYLA